MAKVTTETVARIAKLASLSLTDDEREKFARQLDEILSYAESIQTLDTSNVPPMSHAGEGGDFREDTPEPCLPQERVLEEAPDPSQGLFRVPRVLA